MPDHIWATWCGHTVAVNVAIYTHARPEDLAAVGTALSRICNALIVPWQADSEWAACAAHRNRVPGTFSPGSRPCRAGHGGTLARAG